MSDQGDDSPSEPRKSARARHRKTFGDDFIDPTKLNFKSREFQQQGLESHPSTSSPLDAPSPSISEITQSAAHSATVPSSSAARSVAPLTAPSAAAVSSAVSSAEKTVTPHNQKSIQNSSRFDNSSGSSNQQESIGEVLTRAMKETGTKHGLPNKDNTDEVVVNTPSEPVRKNRRVVKQPVKRVDSAEEPEIDTEPWKVEDLEIIEADPPARSATHSATRPTASTPSSSAARSVTRTAAPSAAPPATLTSSSSVVRSVAPSDAGTSSARKMVVTNIQNPYRSSSQFENSVLSQNPHENVGAALNRSMNGGIPNRPTRSAIHSVTRPTTSSLAAGSVERSLAHLVTPSGTRLTTVATAEIRTSALARSVAPSVAPSNYSRAVSSSAAGVSSEVSSARKPYTRRILPVHNWKQNFATAPNRQETIGEVLNQAIFDARIKQKYGSPNKDDDEKIAVNQQSGSVRATPSEPPAHAAAIQSQAAGKAYPPPRSATHSATRNTTFELSSWAARAVAPSASPPATRSVAPSTALTSSSSVVRSVAPSTARSRSYVAPGSVARSRALPAASSAVKKPVNPTNSVEEPDSDPDYECDWEVDMAERKYVRKVYSTAHPKYSTTNPTAPTTSSSMTRAAAPLAAPSASRSVGPSAASTSSLSTSRTVAPSAAGVSSEVSSARKMVIQKPNQTLSQLGNSAAASNLQLKSVSDITESLREGNSDVSLNLEESVGAVLNRAMKEARMNTLLNKDDDDEVSVNTPPEPVRRNRRVVRKPVRLGSSVEGEEIDSEVEPDDVDDEDYIQEEGEIPVRSEDNEPLVHVSDDDDETNAPNPDFVFPSGPPGGSVRIVHSHIDFSSGAAASRRALKTAQPFPHRPPVDKPYREEMTPEMEDLVHIGSTSDAHAIWTVCKAREMTQEMEIRLNTEAARNVAAIRAANVQKILETRSSGKSLSFNEQIAQNCELYNYAVNPDPPVAVIGPRVKRKYVKKCDKPPEEVVPTRTPRMIPAHRLDPENARSGYNHSQYNSFPSAPNLRKQLRRMDPSEIEMARQIENYAKRRRLEELHQEILAQKDDREREERMRNLKTSSELYKEKDPVSGTPTTVRRVTIIQQTHNGSTPGTSTQHSTSSAGNGVHTGIVKSLYRQPAPVTDQRRVVMVHEPRGPPLGRPAQLYGGAGVVPKPTQPPQPPVTDQRRVVMAQGPGGSRPPLGRPAQLYEGAGVVPKPNHPAQSQPAPATTQRRVVMAQGPAGSMQPLGRPAQLYGGVGVVPKPTHPSQAPVTDQRRVMIVHGPRGPPLGRPVQLYGDVVFPKPTQPPQSQPGRSRSVYRLPVSQEVIRVSSQNQPGAGTSSFDQLTTRGQSVGDVLRRQQRLKERAQAEAASNMTTRQMTQSTSPASNVTQNATGASKPTFKLPVKVIPKPAPAQKPIGAGTTPYKRTSPTQLNEMRKEVEEKKRQLRQQLVDAANATANATNNGLLSEIKDELPCEKLRREMKPQNLIEAPENGSKDTSVEAASSSTTPPMIQPTVTSQSSTANQLLKEVKQEEPDHVDEPEPSIGKEPTLDREVKVEQEESTMAEDPIFGNESTLDSLANMETEVQPHFSTELQPKLEEPDSEKIVTRKRQREESFSSSYSSENEEEENPFRYLQPTEGPIYLGAQEPMKDMNPDQYNARRYTIKKVEKFNGAQLLPFVQEGARKYHIAPGRQVESVPIEEPDDETILKMQWEKIDAERMEKRAKKYAMDEEKHRQDRALAQKITMNEYSIAQYMQSEEFQKTCELNPEMTPLERIVKRHNALEKMTCYSEKLSQSNPELYNRLKSIHHDAQKGQLPPRFPVKFPSKVKTSSSRSQVKQQRAVPLEELTSDKLPPANLVNMMWNGETVELPEWIPCHLCNAVMTMGLRRSNYKGMLREYPAYRCLRKGCQTFRSVKKQIDSMDPQPYMKLKKKNVYVPSRKRFKKADEVDCMPSTSQRPQRTRRNKFSNMSADYVCSTSAEDAARDDLEEDEDDEEYQEKEEEYDEEERRHIFVEGLDEELKAIDDVMDAEEDDELLDFTEFYKGSGQTTNEELRAQILEATQNFVSPKEEGIEEEFPYEEEDPSNDSEPASMNRSFRMVDVCEDDYVLEDDYALEDAIYK